MQLAAATEGLDLDFFVCFSSAAALFGAAGQANYAAANAALAALAATLRDRGVPATCIDWGPWGQVGLAAQKEDRGARLADRGAAGLSIEDALAALGRALLLRERRLAIMHFDFRQWCEFDLAAAANPFFSELAAEAEVPADASQGTFLLELETTANTGRRAKIESHLRESIAKTMRIPTARIGSRTPLGSLGFDSLASLEIRNRLERTLGIRLSATLLWAHPTVESIAEVLAERLGFALEEAPEAAADECAVMASSDVAALLARELDALPAEFTDDIQ
jgi:acyl carrier protein